MKTKYIILAVVIVVLFVGAIAVYRQLSKKYTPPMDLPPTTAGKMPDATTPSDGITVEPKPSSQTNPSTEGTTSGKKPDATEDIKKNTAPDFTVLDKDGNTVRLSEKFGKPIVINFWATWCPPCKQELPDFDKLCKEYGDRIVFMMVNLTDGYRDTVDLFQARATHSPYILIQRTMPQAHTMFRLSRRLHLSTQKEIYILRA